jgi:hypothetical protein
MYYTLLILSLRNVYYAVYNIHFFLKLLIYNLNRTCYINTSVYKMLSLWEIDIRLSMRIKYQYRLYIIRDEIKKAEAILVTGRGGP